MAGKQPYPGSGYPQPPPPAYGQPPPPYQPPGATSHTVVVQQGPQRTTVIQKPSRGLFGSLMHEADKLGKRVDQEINYCSTKINQAVDQSVTSPVLGMFQTGNVVQLISRASGGCLQIVTSPTGTLVVDGSGQTDKQEFNTLWTVVSEGNNQVRLHNNNNYLTIVNGNTALISMPPGTLHGVETKFQLSFNEQQFVMFQSVKELGRFIGILPNGQLKSALATGRDLNANFGVRLVYTPYGAARGNVTPVKK